MHQVATFSLPLKHGLQGPFPWALIMVSSILLVFGSGVNFNRFPTEKILYFSSLEILLIIRRKKLFVNYKIYF